MSDIIKRLFTSLIRPHLEYVNVVFHPWYKKDMDQLERVQRCATNLAIGLHNMPYEERLKIMDLLSLIYCRYRGDMIEVYKYLNGFYSLHSDSILKKAPPSTLRGHRYKLLKRQSSTHLRLYFVSFWVVSLWNSLPEEVVSAPLPNAFKGWLNEILR